MKISSKINEEDRKPGQIRFILLTFDGRTKDSMKDTEIENGKKNAKKVL